MRCVVASCAHRKGRSFGLWCGSVCFELGNQMTDLLFRQKEPFAAVPLLYFIAVIQLFVFSSSSLPSSSYSAAFSVGQLLTRRDGTTRADICLDGRLCDRYSFLVVFVCLRTLFGSLASESDVPIQALLCGKTKQRMCPRYADARSMTRRKGGFGDLWKLMTTLN